MADGGRVMSDWEAGQSCEAHELPFCFTCKPKLFPESVLVSDGGNVFHVTTACTGLRDGQRSVERRGGRAGELRAVHRETALGRGYVPCLLCFPGARGHA